MFVCVQEEQNRGKPNWEHLNEDLHVLITVEDSQNRAEIKLKRAVEEVKKLLVPAVSHTSTPLTFLPLTLRLLIGTQSENVLSGKKHIDLLQQTRLVGFG